MERDDTRPWYFLHIPKTAGTTFRVLLENCFHMDEICPAYEFFQVKQYSNEQLVRFRLFRGHMGYNLVNYLPQAPRTLVMLRDPMERAVSHFEYIRRDPAHPKHRIIHERNLGLKEYLLDPVLSVEVTNAQVRPLAHLADRAVLRKLLENAGSQQDFARAWPHQEGVLPPDDELLDVALRRLEALDFVGVAEKLDQAMELAAWLLEAPAPEQLQSLNINPGRTRLEALSDDVLDLLKQATLLDRQLYARGSDLFEKQYRQMQEQTGRREKVPPGAMTPVVQDGRLVVDFKQPLCGRGWHQRELVPGRGVLRWSGPGCSSDIHVALPVGRDYRLQIVLADWLDDALLRALRITLNGVPVPAQVLQQAEEVRLQADLKASLPASAEGRLRIGLELPYTGVRGGGEARVIDHSHARKLGVAVYRFEFIPA
ncbi:hypothetical protein [Thiolapillus sp.]